MIQKVPERQDSYRIMFCGQGYLDVLDNALKSVSIGSLSEGRVRVAISAVQDFLCHLR